MGIEGQEDGSDSQPPAGPGWQEEWVTGVGLLPSYWPQRMMDAVVADAARPPGHTAIEQPDPLWERWFERALEDGLDDDLASLGRSLIREAHVQGWRGERLAECGWLDDGETMLERALVDPERMRARWQALLDGER